MISQWGFVLTPEVLSQTAREIGETSILSRAGGAPTLAVGMAQILHGLVGGEGMMAFWYHYAILFEALFILTTVDAGTRVGRFMIQELGGARVRAAQADGLLEREPGGDGVCVAGWGYFLYQGVVDPLGGINTLWPLFGIANQMLAAIALTLASVVLVKMKRERYLWIPALPTAWLVVCTLTAGWQKVFSGDIRVSFLAHARAFSAAMESGKVMAPAKTAGGDAAGHHQRLRGCFPHRALHAGGRDDAGVRPPRRARGPSRGAAHGSGDTSHPSAVDPEMRRLRDELSRLWRRAVQTARLVIGVPDYDTYVQHMRLHHPERPVMSYAEFFDERMQARYRGGGGRCC